MQSSPQEASAGTALANVALRNLGLADSKQPIAALYYTIASQRVLDRPVALQFVAPGAKAGTSLVARQFAAFASQAQGGSSLLIDCGTRVSDRLLAHGPRGRPCVLDAFADDGRIDAALVPVEGVEGLHVAQLSRDAGGVLQASSQVMSEILDQARARYQFTALDTPAYDDFAVTLTFSRISDGVVLVVEADATTAISAEETIEAIERSGGKFLGLVFNKRRLHMPRWLHRRI